MRVVTIVCLLLTNACFSQNLQADFMVGVAGYSGDLTQKAISFKTVGPAVSANIKYPLYMNYLLLRGGFAYGFIRGNDKNNALDAYKERNLNFKSSILEGSVCLELNLLNPDDYIGFPYVFGGVGLFHFNPTTKDKDGKKVRLWDLGTEGQGLITYPDKKMYSLTQVCLPFGGGWKYKLTDDISIEYELGGRLLFTDYLDDVSGSYANPQVLSAARGATGRRIGLSRQFAQRSDRRWPERQLQKE